MNKIEKRASIFGTGDEPIRHFLRIPARTLLAKDENGRFFPVSDDDPRAVAFTPEETLHDLDRPKGIATIATPAQF